MANDKVAIWNQTLKLGRVPANGELLIGNGSDFTLANITAGSGATITNTAGGIQISATGSGGTVTSVTASSPLASSGGNTPDISLSGTIGVGNGGTGATTLTLNNVILGNGTSAVQFVAPGTSGNVLTSNGTTWQSTAPAQTWTLVKKTSDQNLNTSSTAYQDVTSLSFSMAANTSYRFRAQLIITSPSTGSSGGGIKMSINGPAAPTSMYFAGTVNGTDGTAYDTTVVDVSAQSVQYTMDLWISGIVNNGANAGTLIVRASQRASAAGTTVVRKGSYIEYTVWT